MAQAVKASRQDGVLFVMVFGGVDGSLSCHSGCHVAEGVVAGVMGVCRRATVELAGVFCGLRWGMGFGVLCLASRGVTLLGDVGLGFGVKFTAIQPHHPTSRFLCYKRNRPSLRPSAIFTTSAHQENVAFHGLLATE